MAIGTLSIDLEARLGRLEGDLSRATKLIERDAGKMQKAFAASSAAISNVIGLLGTGVAAGWVVNLTRNALAGVDALNDFADATGTTVEKASALEQVGLRTGTSLDVIGAAVVKLNQGLAAGNEDSPTAKALARIGLTATELRQLDPADAIKRVADTLAGFADDGDKARLVQDLFGKSVREVAPLLKDLNEQGELNGRVTAAQAAEVDKLNKAIFQLQGSFTNLSRDILGAVVPALNEVFARIKAGQEVFGSFGATIRAGLGNKAFQDAGAGVQFYTDKLEKLRATRDIIVSKGGNDPFRGSLGDVDKQIAEAQKLEQFYRRSFALTAPDAGQSDARELARRGRGAGLARVGAPTADAPRGGRAPRAVADEKAFIPSVPEELTNALRRLEQVDSARLASLRKELELLVQYAAGGNSAAAEALPGVAEEIAKLDPAGRAAAAGLEQAAEQAARLNALLSDTQASKLKVVTDDITFLNAQFAEGKIASVEQWAEAVRNATSRIGEAEKATKSADDVSRDLGLTFASAAEDAISNFKNLGDVLKGLEQDILRIFARELITKPLGDAVSSFASSLIKPSAGGGSSSGSSEAGNFIATLLGSFLGSANGNAFGPAGLVPFANGGIVDRPTVFKFGGNRNGLMGEAGPEAIMPLQRGRDGKLGLAGGGGNTTNITVMVQAQPGMSRDTAQQQGLAYGRGIQQALARNG